MEIIFKESTQSTNEDAKALPENADHIAVCAKTQTGGHGRLGRKWISPAGNLYVSFCIRLDNLAAAGNYSFLSAVALAQALESFGLKPQCKWPNDLLIDGKKVSGILLETDGKSRLIVGIGVNLLPVEAENLLYPVTSLANEGVETTPREVLSRLVECFEAFEKLPFSARLVIAVTRTSCRPFSLSQVACPVDGTPLHLSSSQVSHHGYNVVRTIPGKERAWMQW